MIKNEQPAARLWKTYILATRGTLENYTRFGKNKTLRFPHTDAETGLKSKVMRKVCELEPDPKPPDDRT